MTCLSNFPIKKVCNCVNLVYIKTSLRNINPEKSHQLDVGA
ncbi:hypothetical protein WCLE_010520 [Wolbachia endosymbiont of Cimex lectularius]|nr:hypothetical protein WCLE_010520 [Wolbachia endosymbiont of Cimex lectularius]